MRLVILTLFFILSTNCSNKKTDFDKYNQLIFKAMLQFKKKDFKNALSNFETAIRIKPRNEVSDYFFASASALNLNNKKKAKKIILDAILKVNASKEYFLNFEEFDDFRQLKIFEEIFNEYEHHQSKFYQTIKNPKIYKEIDSLIRQDQLIRSGGLNNADLMTIDSSNISRLIDITKQYGWQKKGWLLLWHQRGTYGQDNYVWNFFKPYINDEIRKGIINKDFWTMFEDEYLIRTEKKQIYGNYWSQYNEYPIIDIKNIDKRRNEKGLPPLWYMEKIYNIKLPEEYRKTLNSESQILDE